MAGKLLGFVGSPRKGGNTDILVDEALDAFKEDGGTTEKVMLSSLRINPCQGWDCWIIRGLQNSRDARLGRIFRRRRAYLLSLSVDIDKAKAMVREELSNRIEEDVTFR